MSYTTIALLLCASSYVFYMTKLHPLAKYPGPFLAKLTNLYSVWHAFWGTRHSDIYLLHQEHGEFVRWGPNNISINSAAALEPLYGSKANVQKSYWYTSFYSVSVFNVIDKEIHARKKRVMSHAFSDQAFREIQPYILQVVREWCACLGDRFDPGTVPIKSEWASPKDMRDWAAYNIFDSLGEVLLGESFKTTSSTEDRFFLGLLPEVVRFNNITGQMPILTRLHLDKVFLRRQKERRTKQISFAVGALRKRLALGPDSNGRRDIIHYLQQARDPETGEGYSEKELIGETVLLLGAGSDTANTALTSIWYFLAHHPSVLERLTNSIREGVKSVEDISDAHTLASNDYLRACIDESMRLCPPVPMLLPRDVCAGGLQIKGHHFAPGSVVGVPTYALHHNNEYFERPFQYDPTRWLIKGSGRDPHEGNSAEVVARQRQAFVPVSIGPRACIGRSVALFELYVSVARVLFLYDIRLQPGTEQLGVGPHREYKIRDHFIVGKEGPVLQFRLYESDAA